MSLAILPYVDALNRLLEVPSSPRLGLSRMQELLVALDNPHHQFRTLHVAGTNGKGSTLAFATALLEQAGVRYGRTTSPHLTSACERIVVEGAPVSRDEFCRLEARVANAALNVDDTPTFYERMVAMAFCAFADARVSIALVEVGLGGRLDATNVITPVACGITRIGLDHTQFLGETIAEIAGEKAGILKPGVPAFVAPQLSAAADAIVARAAEIGASLEVVTPRAGVLGLFGAHQRINAAIAVALVRAADIDLAAAEIETALASASWPGRFEVFERAHSATLVLDGAHNTDSAAGLAHSLSSHPRTSGRPCTLVVGATRGHDPTAFALALKRAGANVERVWATRARAPRSIAMEDVAVGWRRVFPEEAVQCAEVEGVLHAAFEPKGEGAVVVVTGSLYLVGEIRSACVVMVVDPELPDF